MLKCYQCGWSNPDETNRCQKCGQQLAMSRDNKSIPVIPSTGHSHICDNCGYPTSALLNFCPWCGNGKNSNVSKPVIPESYAYLERVVDGKSVFIPLEDTHEVVIGGISFIYHQR